MTSYVSLNRLVTIFTGCYLNMSMNAVQNVMVSLLRGLNNYPDSVTQLERQYLQILTRAAYRRVAPQSELDTVHDRLQEWPNLRPGLNDIDGHPRFYEFALKLSTQERLVLFDESGSFEEIHGDPRLLLIRVNPDVERYQNCFYTVVEEAMDVSMRVILQFRPMSLTLVIKETLVSN